MESSSYDATLTIGNFQKFSSKPWRYVLEKKQHELLSMQVKQLYALAPVGIIASLINGPLLIFIQWNQISHKVLLSWLTALVLLNLLWIVLYMQFQQSSQRSWRPNVWRYWFIGGTFASGCIWGATGIISFPEHS